MQSLFLFLCLSTLTSGNLHFKPIIPENDELSVYPSDLSVEYQSNTLPPVVDTPAPRFSWTLQTNSPKQRAIVQESYQILVTTNASSMIVWDSGKVLNNETLHIEYNGSALCSDTSYSWKVRVWTNKYGASAYISGFFSTALLTPSDWIASWITSQKGNSQFRTEFQLEKLTSPVRVTAYFAGLGYGHMFINGQRVQSSGGGDELGPWTTWTKRILYRSYNVPPNILRNGTNAIGVRLGNGQWNSHWHKGHLALRLQVNIHLVNGSTVIIKSDDKKWKDAPSPIIKNDIYLGETYDARMEQDGWAKPGFDDRSWTRSVIVQSGEELSGQMSLHMFTPIRIVAERKPIRMHEPSAGVFVFDFGTNHVGWAMLRGINGHAPGTTITLQFSEQLQFPNGTKCLVDCNEDNTTLIWYPFGGQTDVFILSGVANESVESHFTYHGYQFCQISGWPVVTSGKPTINSIISKTIHSDNKKIANLSFPEDSSLFGKMQNNLIRSLLSNMHSVESDCPTRERVGWTGDAQATALSAIRNLDMASFYTKWVQDMQDAQHSNGALSSTIPFAKHVPPVDPSWPTAYPQLVNLLYKYYGDIRLIKLHYNSIKKYVEYVGTVQSCPHCRSPTNKKTQTPDGLPWFYMNGDWMEYRAQKDELVMSGPQLSSFHYILDLKLVATFAKVLGQADDELLYSKQAANMTKLYNKQYLISNQKTCGLQREPKKGGQKIHLYCGNGDIIKKIDFASFGTPHGSCISNTESNFTVNHTCTANNTMVLIQSKCLNQNECILSADVGSMGGDPCIGTIKSLAVQVSCNSSNSSFSYGAGQTINAVPLIHNFTPPDKMQGVLDDLITNIVQTHSKHLTTGFIGNKYILPCLTQFGYQKLAMDVALQETLPSWGYQIVNGATTIWENWSGVGDITNGGDNPSHNHHFMGGYGQWFHESLIGLKQGNGIAFSQMLIQPEIVNDPRLPWASANYSLPRGLVYVSWRRLDRCGFGINVTVHLNANATVFLPFLCENHNYLVTESLHVIWPKTKDAIDGIFTLEKKQGRNSSLTIEIGSGTFQFLAT